MQWERPFDPGQAESLPEMGQADLLDAIVESIEGQPWANWREIGVDNLELGGEVQEAMLLAQRYADRRYSPEALFRRIGELICRDDFTELHGIKHHQALGRRVLCDPGAVPVEPPGGGCEVGGGGRGR